MRRHKSKKHHKMTAKEFEGSKMDKDVDEAMMRNMHKSKKHKEEGKHHKVMCKTCGKHKSHMKHKAHMKPKGAKGRAQVKKLGRTFKTGGFSKIAKAAGKEYGSKEAGKRVAGAIFQRMASKHAGKK